MLEHCQFTTGATMEQDWSTYLIKAEALVRKATEDLNAKNWERADEKLADIVHNARMARFWLSNSNKL
jgi:hypothetical protein